MPRVTTADLRMRIDGLALAFFVVTGAILDELAKVLPEGEEAILEMYVSVTTIIGSVDEWPQDVFSSAAVENALRAVNAAFAARVDDEDESGEVSDGAVRSS